MAKSTAAKNLLSSIGALNAFAKEVATLGEVEDELAKKEKVLAGLNKKVAKAEEELSAVDERLAEAEKKAGVAERYAKATRADADKVLADARQTASAIVEAAEKRAKELDAYVTRESTRIDAMRAA